MNSYSLSAALSGTAKERSLEVVLIRELDAVDGEGDFL